MGLELFLLEGIIREWLWYELYFYYTQNKGLYFLIFISECYNGEWFEIVLKGKYLKGVFCGIGIY